MDVLRIIQVLAKPLFKSSTFLILLIVFYSQATMIAQVKTDSASRAEFRYHMKEVERLRDEYSRLLNAGRITTNSNNFEIDFFIFKGDILEFVTKGKISTGDFSGYTGPGGHLNYISNLFNVVKDKPYGAFLCKIGEDGDYILLGDSIKFEAKTSGRLKVLVNDLDISDNRGKFESTFYLESKFSDEDHKIQREGNLVYLTDNQRKELERIRAERQYREENKERLAEEARKEEARKRAERKEDLRLAKEKSRLENPVTLSEKESKDLLYACIGYTLTSRHENNFRIFKKTDKVSKRISATSIEKRKESHESVISSLVVKGAESQLTNFTESLQTAAIRISDFTDDFALINAVLNTMDSSTVGLNIPQIRKDIDLNYVNDLIIKEKEESVTLRFSKTEPAGGFFGGEVTRWGLKNSLTGEIIVEPNYLFIGLSDEGLRVSQDDQRAIGFLDDKGEIAIPFIYKAGSNFSSGLAPVTKNGERWGYINKKGEVVISFKFAKAYRFDVDYQGLAKVNRYITNQVIYIDTNGKRVKNPK